jgi:hypothetical protein
VAHACNPSYFRGRDWEDIGSRQPRQKVHKIQSQSICWEWLVCACHPAAQEVQVRGPQSGVNASQGRKEGREEGREGGRKEGSS